MNRGDATRLREPEVLHHDELLQLGAIDDLFVERWTGPSTVDSVHTLMATHMRFLRAHAPARTLHLVVLDAPRMAVPDAKLRALIDERTRAIDPHLDAAALVVTATGFAAAAMRATISAASLLRRSRYPFGVFATKLEAFPWLARQRGRDAVELEAAYAAFERASMHRARL